MWDSSCLFPPLVTCWRLKLKALRVSDFEKGRQDMADVGHLLKALDLTEVEPAIAILGGILSEERCRFRQAAICAKASVVQRDFNRCAPLPSHRPLNALSRENRSTRRFRNFSTSFIWQRRLLSRMPCLPMRPPPTGDAHLDGLFGGIAEYLARQFVLSRVPAWAFSPSRYLDHAWHTSSISR